MLVAKRLVLVKLKLHNRCKSSILLGKYVSVLWALITYRKSIYMQRGWFDEHRPVAVDVISNLAVG